VPAGIVGKLNAEINTILSADDMKARLAHEGAEPVMMSPDEVNKFIRSEIAKFRQDHPSATPSRLPLLDEEGSLF
jgi:tripartite-type tricarboxylate transporter receptor subunit TctC